MIVDVDNQPRLNTARSMFKRCDLVISAVPFAKYKKDETSQEQFSNFDQFGFKIAWLFRITRDSSGSLGIRVDHLGEADA